MSCIRGNYNIAVKVVDEQNMIYQDLSDWMTGPPDYTVSITKPAASESIDVEVSGTNNTRISETEIGTIIDGIYTFETTSCGIRYTRKKGLFFSLECCIKKAYKDVSPRLYDLVRDVEQYLQMTKSAIEINNIALAEDLYEITKDKMDRIKCDCGC